MRLCTRERFDEGVGKAGCFALVLGGRDPQRAGPQPDVLLIEPLRMGRLQWRGAGPRVGGCSTADAPYGGATTPSGTLPQHA